MVLKGKKILLGITGSIAAYKSAVLCRWLMKSGAEVRIIMTAAAKEFITPLTLSTLSGHKVLSDWKEDGVWANHVEAGLWADLMIVAPATANTISKMAHGEADNILLATYLSARCPVIVAPAMDLDMWAHPSTKNNLSLLESYGNIIIPVGHGLLASGLTGDGRMAEPEEIGSFITDYFKSKEDLQGKKVLITAGPTYEAIDPVRFIGNHSSGKMGYAIAENCAMRGAEVVLVSGPVALTVKHGDILLERVTSAEEMALAVEKHQSTCDAFILAAAVADFKPEKVAGQKIKKQSDTWELTLVKTVDIAARIGRSKNENQILVGFALETNNEINNASLKLHKKNMDFIVLNSLSDQGAGFKHDTNKITILDKDGSMVPFELKSKKWVAIDIVDYLSKKWNEK